MSNKPIVVPLVAAALGFTGAMGASYLGAKQEQKNWSAQYEVEQRSKKLDKRIELIEEMLRLYTDVEDYKLKIELLGISADIARLALVCTAKAIEEKTDPDICKKYEKANTNEIYNDTLEIRKRFRVTASMSALFFGPNTKARLKEVDASEDKWWIAFEQKGQSIYDAMYSELYYENDKL